MSIPNWWLVLTGVFFGLAILLTCLMAFLIVNLIGMLRKLQDQVAVLTARADEIGVEVKSIAQQVNLLTRNTAARAERLGGTMDLVSTQLRARSQWISAGLTALTVVRSLIAKHRSAKG